MKTVIISIINKEGYKVGIMKPTIYEYKVNLKHLIRLSLAAIGLRYDTIDGYLIGNKLIKVRISNKKDITVVTMNKDLDIYDVRRIL